MGPSVGQPPALGCAGDLSGEGQDAEFHGLLLLVGCHHTAVLDAGTEGAVQWPFVWG